MKISIKMPTTTDAFNQAVLAQLATVEEQRFLFWQVDQAQQGAVIELIERLDVPFASQADGIALMVKQAALPVLVKWAKQAWPADDELQSSLEALTKEPAILWRAGRFTFNVTAHPLVYGILNVTPDSFYDGGRYQATDDVKAHIDQMVKDGADIIEVGGQTTKPGGFVEVSPDEEIKRITPAIEYLKANYPAVAIAVDTYKYPVMQAAVELGVDIINDVNAFLDDDQKLTLLKDSQVGLVTMHSSREHEYENLTVAMKHFFEENLAMLEKAGIDRERVLLDQGIGYSKVADGEQDYAMMRNLDQFNYLKRPMIVAISRKGFGKQLFGLAKDDRLDVTLIAESYMYLHGGRVLRVHDVKETKQLVKMLDTITSGYWQL
ncbi:dihydropteroate synthase [Limosilactobacillus fermentum]|uniref:dihydropteroate synthase n=1 Tax=Limosilactobacillus fermentum TaxID=1613 RepID=UPI001FB5C362|nr:dihydropteroate synthase [Limosilactobacillus fermentum]UOG12395.1 dihydropteroate synthase [Limosilactobacillus fermentum]